MKTVPALLALMCLAGAHVSDGRAAVPTAPAVPAMTRAAYHLDGILGTSADFTFVSASPRAADRAERVAVAEIERLRRSRDEALARVGNVKMERDGAKKRVAELEARVAELEAVTKSQSVSPTTEETSQQPLLTAEEKKAADFCAQLLYKNYPHVAKPMRELHDRSGSAPSLTLTAEERAVLTKARDAYADDNDDEECATAERVIDGLLARAGGDA